MRIRVQVKTRARQERVERSGEGQFKVWVKAAPEKGRANEAVIGALSGYFSVPRSRIRLLTGQTATRKLFEVI